ncbi:unnamed protein product [Caenorhabditis bovis]|uniref:Uncharacterized protein n=1 Tax=Caenorhabditis bovis TaxID=2654633 RepID=A0A8S1FB72_9PELO|nr:unnamed protein product [Caenorhabditis bovis]
MDKNQPDEKERLLGEDLKNEKERLLGEDLKIDRIPSARFQVSRSGGENGILDFEKINDLETTDDLRMIKAGSEPPVSLNVNGPTVTRKISATGRFMVTSEAPSSSANLENISDSEDTPEDTSSGQTAPAARQRGVHFSVGDKDAASMSEEADEKRREQYTENQSTFNMKSWRNMKTIEHPPIIDFYRNSVDTDGIFMRPSMAQLIHGNAAIPEEIGFDELNAHNHHLDESPVGDEEKKSARLEKMKAPQTQSRVKFGWIQGVFVRCLLNIFGVMLYLRISWVAGQAGLALGSCIVILASIVTTITALSTCAICSNGDVKGGGAYFLISRSLGPEFGGSIGIIFSVANAVGASMYVVGFAETVRDVLKEYGYTIIDGQMWDVRIIGFVTCIALMAIVFIGTEFESKMQMGLLVILLASIADYAIGSLFPPNSEARLRGATGYSWDTLRTNFMPEFHVNGHFFTVFAVYFPAATGIMAGANISGDLADPQRAIPLGTLLAIVVTSIVYLVTLWMTGSTFVRHADGISPPMFNESVFVPPECAENATCPYGLMNFYQVLETESLWGPLITAGIIAATLSSALASLVSAPKVFQAVCKDRLFPKIDYFAKSYGKNEEPKRAYALAFVIAFAMIAIGDLNVIAPIISNFFLCSYALINYACFDQSFADSPGFRPGFKYYNMWVSLIGALLCITVMFIVSYKTALITFFCFAVIFMYILHRKPDVNWGSSTQAHSYKNALSAMIKLASTEEHVKNYRPQFLVLTGNPAARPSLVDFANNITKGTSLLVCGYVVPYEPTDRVFSVIRKLDRQLNDWLRKRRVKAFYQSIANPSLRQGAQALFQLTGFSKLKPNIVLMGFKSNWYREGPNDANLNEMNEYFGTIQDVFDSNMAMCVLRNGNAGLDFSDAMKLLNVGETNRIKLPPVEEKKEPERMKLIETDETKENEKTDENNQKQKNEQKMQDDGSSSASINEYVYDENNEEMVNGIDDDDDGDNYESAKEEEPEDVEKAEENEHEKKHHFSLRRRGSRRHTMEQKALLASISRFQRKVKKGIIDVWWLYDDGGLTLLIPHLLTIPKSYLEGARLRIFTISTSSRTMEQEQRGMAALLSKFRIDFSDVSVIADIGKKPKAETMKAWQGIIDPFIAQDGNCPQGMTTSSELSAQRDKTYRQLRAGELLQEHSSRSDLIVMTLPVPRKGLISASLYLSWLEVMTRNLPPVLLVRGNQQSVLTFYS